jgi:hypothetical protein
MDSLDGRYNWHDPVDPEAAEFLASSSLLILPAITSWNISTPRGVENLHVIIAGSINYQLDGWTAVSYVGRYDEGGEAICDVGVRVSELQGGLGTGYWVRVENERISISNP